MKKITTFLLAVVIVAAFSFVLVACDKECEHTWNDDEITTASTCEADGVKTFTCTKCSETKTETISASGHNWGTGVVTTEAKCTEDGVKTFTCSSCQQTKTEKISSSGHDIVSVKAKAATCTEEGYEAHEKCNKCAYTTIKTIPKTNHIYFDAVTKPTCQEKGYTTYTCECGEIYVDNYVDKNPDNHVYSSQTTQATCNEQGYTTYTCPCGDTYVDDYTPMLTQHAFVDGFCSCGAHEASINALTFADYGDYYEVTACQKTYSGKLYIPAAHLGKPVKSIGEYALNNCQNITEIDIPSSIKIIRRGALSNTSFKTTLYNGCYYIGNQQNPYMVVTGIEAENRIDGPTSYTLHENTTIVGPEAFSKAVNLKNMVLSDKVTCICDGAFYADRLRTINIPDTLEYLGNDAFNYGSSTALQFYREGNNAYLGNENNKYLILFEGAPDSNGVFTAKQETRFIYDYAFNQDYNLSKVVLHDNIKTIGQFAFNECKYLSSITLPNGLEEMRKQMLYCASPQSASLNTVVIPESVRYIGMNIVKDWAYVGFFYKGTPEQWEGITASVSANTNYGLTVKFYSETQPTDTVKKYWYFDEQGVIKLWK